MGEWYDVKVGAVLGQDIDVRCLWLHKMRSNLTPATVLTKPMPLSEFRGISVRVNIRLVAT